MSKLTLRLVAAALVVAAIFWARVVQVHVAKKPARSFTFVGRNGPYAGPNYCHGSAIADGDVIWQVCRNIGNDTWLTRFVPARGVAEMLWSVDVSNRLEGFAKDSAGAPLVVVGPSSGARLFRVGGELTQLGSFKDGIAGFAANGDAIEVVSGRFPDHPYLYTWRNGAWTERRLPAAAVGEDQWLAVQGAEGRDGAWRVVYLRGARRGALPIDVDVLVGSESAPPEKAATMKLGAPFLFASAAGFIHPMSIAVRVAQANVFTAPLLAHPADLPMDWENGQLVAPAPLFAAPFASYDFVYRPLGHQRIIGLEDLYKSASRIGDEWVVAEGDKRVRLTRVRDGKISAPIDRFHLGPGYKLFPTGTGYLVMGGLGERYARFDADLARSDVMSFGERFRKLFRDATSTESFAVGWALFAPLGIALALLAGKRLERGVQIAAIAWLVVMVIAGWTAWRMIGLL